MANIGGSAFLELVAKGRAYGRTRNQYVLSLLKSECQSRRIDSNLEGTRLQVSVNGVPRIRASWQLIGTQHSKEHRWRWSWADTRLDAKATEDAVLTRRYGEKQVIYELITPDLPDDDNLPFNLTWVAAMLCSGDTVWPVVREGRPTEFLVLHELSEVSRASA